MTITEMRICRWCHFPFEGPSKRLAACCKCGTSERAWSIAASNASQDDLVGAIPHMLTAIQELRYALADMGKELAAVKARKP